MGRRERLYQAERTEIGNALLANSSLLARVVMSLNNKVPGAAPYIDSFNRIVDDLGSLAQYLMGKEKSSEILQQSQTIDQLFEQAMCIQNRSEK